MWMNQQWFAVSIIIFSDSYGIFTSTPCHYCPSNWINLMDSKYIAIYIYKLNSKCGFERIMHRTVLGIVISFSNNYHPKQLIWSGIFDFFITNRLTAHDSWMTMDWSNGYFAMFWSGARTKCSSSIKTILNSFIPTTNRLGLYFLYFMVATTETGPVCAIF